VDAAFNTSTSCGEGDCSATGPMACSCTQSSRYWSGTEFNVPIYAWDVDFGSGLVQFDTYPSVFHVRAVRGGL
jgi:hypothetical protein